MAKKKTVKKKKASRGSTKPRKNFHQYLTIPTKSHVTQEDYFKSPATAFLRYTLEAKDAIEYCKNNFPKQQSDGKLKKAAVDSVQHLITAVIPTLMGHFETFQRHIFAGSIDFSLYLDQFDIDHFFKKLNQNLTIDPKRLLAYRGQGPASIGLVLADSLQGWHDPQRVNIYFKAIVDHSFFSNQNCESLDILWQLRHSIVHTGGTLTVPDAQKNKYLVSKARQQIAFENGFIWQVSRKMHVMIKRSVDAYYLKFKEKLKTNLSHEIRTNLDQFFSVESTNKNFFK